MKKRWFLSLLALALVCAVGCTGCAQKEEERKEAITGKNTIGEIVVEQQEASSDMSNAGDGSNEGNVNDKKDVNGENDELVGMDESAETCRNEFFSVRLKSREEDQEKNSVKLIFEFTNIADEVYFKNDEEIQPGATWEKGIYDSVDRWKQTGVGKDNWIHYRLFDDRQQEIFRGGLCFRVDENIQVTYMELFAE